jgi:hypothetical protein
MSGVMGGPPQPQAGPPPGMPPANVVPFPGAPPPPQINPAYAQWEQQFLKPHQQATQENAKRQAEFDAAFELIGRDGLHGFRLDIETDSTIEPDQTAEKQARIEFMQQIVPLITGIVPMAQGNPAMSALAKEVVMFAVRGFNVGRSMEEPIEAAFDAIAKMPPNPKATGQGEKGGAAPPNPEVEMAKVKADVHDSDTKAKADMAAVQQKQQAALLASQTKMADIEERREDNRADIAVAMAQLRQREIAEQQRMRAEASKAAMKGLE